MALFFMAVSAEGQVLFQKKYEFMNRNDCIRNQFPSTIVPTRNSGFVTTNITTDI
ncbi:MAG TPA: hypothetical protein VEC36_12045 [Patescibacteria group bacterium]|nr:hypothetical protein [Patescibacteria group bacterium]